MPGRRLNNGQKVFAMRLFNYFKMELEVGGALTRPSSLQQRVCEALGISVRTVGRVIQNHQLTITQPEEEEEEEADDVQEEEEEADDVQLEEEADNVQLEEEAGNVQPAEGYASKSTRSKRRKYYHHPRKRWKTSDLPAVVKMDVRRTFSDMLAKRQRVSVETLRHKLVDRQVLNISTESLRRLLRELGFKYSKDNKCYSCDPDR